MIVRALVADNAELDKCEWVTIDSVRNHCARHFPVQSVAKATYRQILERRAKANSVDVVEGVATALTPIAFFETVMVENYENLVDSNTKVDVNTGIVAAGRLQSLIDSGDDGRELLVLKVQPGWIQAAVKSTVPEEMWGEIIESWRSLSSTRRRSTSARTPSMTLTTRPTTRPSSPRTTTGFDLRSAHRHRGRCGPLPGVDGRSRSRERSPHPLGGIHLRRPSDGHILSGWTAIISMPP